MKHFTARAHLARLVGAGAILFGCIHCTPSSHAKTAKPVDFGQNETNTELESVSVFVPPDLQMAPVVQQLRNELQEEFNVLVTSVENNRDAATLVARTLRAQQPSAVILLNNSTARAYRQWATRIKNPPVAVLLMSSFAKRLQKTIPNAVGIAYEVPAVTSLVGLRALGLQINTVGVIYRGTFDSYIRSEVELARVEKLRFVTQRLENEPSIRDLKAAIVRLKRTGVDVIWLPNDNALLSPQFVAKGWLPYLKRVNIPVVVGVPSLVRSDHDFGTFGAIPDPEAMAIQAADLLYDIADADWSTEGIGVNLPLSVKTYVAPQLARRHGMLDAQLKTVDVIVGQEKSDEE